MTLALDDRTAVDTLGARVSIRHPSAALGEIGEHHPPLVRHLYPIHGPAWVGPELWANSQAAYDDSPKNAALMVAPLRYSSSAASIDRNSEEWLRGIVDFLSAVTVRLRRLYESSRDPNEQIDPIERDVLRSVIEYLARMATTSRIRQPKMFPLADGGISLQWRLPDGVAVVEFDADGDRIAMIRTSGSRRSGPLDRLDADILNLIAR